MPLDKKRPTAKVAKSGLAGKSAGKKATRDRWEVDEFLFGPDLKSEELEPHPIDDLDVLEVVNTKKSVLKKAIKKAAEVEPIPEVAPSRVAFGSTQERPMLPEDLPPSRIGATSYYKSQTEACANSYNNDYYTSDDYIRTKITSLNTKGWGFGNRSWGRFPIQKEPELDYQNLTRFPEPCKKAIYPFHSSAPRFQERVSNTPGPGWYDPYPEIGKRVVIGDIFGTTPKKITIRPVTPEMEEERRRMIEEMKLQLYY